MTVEPTATHAPKGREAPACCEARTSPQPEGETGSSQSFHWHWSCRRDHLVSRDHPGLLFRSDFGIFVTKGALTRLGDAAQSVKKLADDVE
jgi:hypothetical protein